jgi:hypothetical protein
VKYVSDCFLSVWKFDWTLDISRITSWQASSQAHSLDSHSYGTCKTCPKELRVCRDDCSSSCSCRSCLSYCSFWLWELLSLPYSGARYLNDNHLTSIESGAFTGLTSIYWLYELSTPFCSFIIYIFCVTTQFRCSRVLSSNRISTIASSALSEISSIYWLYVSDSGCRAYVTWPHGASAHLTSEV